MCHPVCADTSLLYVQFNRVFEYTSSIYQPDIVDPQRQPERAYICGAAS